MALQLLPATVDMTAIEAQIAEAKAAGLNARQMVLNRDPVLNDLKATAALFGSTTAGADAIHAELAEQIAAVRDALAAIQLKAGPAGKDGVNGKDGAPADTSRVTALETDVAALKALKVLVAFGVANLPATLAAGATTNVAVALNRSMGSATYSVGYGLAGGTSLLGQLQATEVVAQTATTVTIAVKNTGLTALLSLSAASLSVVAARDA